MHAAHPVPTPHLVANATMLGNWDALTRSSGGVNYVSWFRYVQYSTVTMDSSLETIVESHWMGNTRNFSLLATFLRSVIFRGFGRLDPWFSEKQEKYVLP